MAKAKGRVAPVGGVENVAPVGGQEDRWRTVECAFFFLEGLWGMVHANTFGQNANITSGRHKLQSAREGDAGIKTRRLVA